MIIIIGLGNPGEEYKNTRHNAGFMVLDKFAKENDFPDFSLEKKYNAEVSEKNKIFLAKPQTFMNNSGKSAGSLAKTYKLKSKNFILIHDDKDLPVGKIKIVKERGSAGHKGVESVIKAIGNKDLARIRVGIAPNSKKTPDAMKLVLKKFGESDKSLLNKSILKSCQALETMIEEGLDQAMNEFNK